MGPANSIIDNNSVLCAPVCRGAYKKDHFVYCVSLGGVSKSEKNVKNVKNMFIKFKKSHVSVYISLILSNIMVNK